MSEKPAPSDRQTDGRFYYKDRLIWKAPKSSKVDGQERVTIGFPVAKVTDLLGDDGGEAIAESLNLAVDKGFLK